MDRIFTITLTIVVDRATYETYLPQHIAYVQQLKQQGVLLLSGPFADRTGGLVIIRANSHDEAEAIVRNDPLVSSGVDRYELREWEIRDRVLENIVDQP
jgi:hypothetical protein